MNRYNKFEQRKTSKRWENLEQAKQGVVGDSANVERVAKARLKAQAIFERIRQGKA